MQKSILMTLLLVASNGAYAEWARVSENQNSVSYADAATILKTGDIAKMSDLLDFRTVQSRPYGAPYLSQKTSREHDCKEGRARVIELIRYSENMGGGDGAPSDAEPGEWEKVAGTANEALWGLACGKR